jgi:hypothetical protein
MSENTWMNRCHILLAKYDCVVAERDYLKEELEIANMRISSQEKLIESLEEHAGVDDRGNSIWVQSSNNFIHKPCCSCGDDPCTCPF